jgi:hypothetical protein
MGSVAQAKMTTREAASILWSAVTWLLGLLIVACYLLPHTLLATMLGFNRIDTIAFGALQMGSYLVVVGAFLAVLSWWWSIARRSSETSILLALIALYALALTADAFYVASVPTLLRQYSLVISSLGIGLLAARLCGTPERILALLSTVGTIGAIYGLYYYTHRIGVVVSGTVVRAGGLYAAPLEFSYVLMVCLPCAIYWLIRLKRPLGMAAGMIATVTILASLLLTFSRMALAASALAAVFSLVRYKRPRRSAITYVVAVLIVCAFAVACRMVGTENIHSSSELLYLFWIGKSGWLLLA